VRQLIIKVSMMKITATVAMAKKIAAQPQGQHADAEAEQPTHFGTRPSSAPRLHRGRALQMARRAARGADRRRAPRWVGCSASASAC